MNILTGQSGEFLETLVMRRSQLKAQEERLNREKGIRYKGTASIEIQVLQFPAQKIGRTSGKNVERLKKVFRNEGCERLILRNHVPAMIHQGQLDLALQASGLSAEHLLTDPHGPRGSYPELNFPTGYRLECLHGQDRVRAAAQVLPPGDRRWTVDLYLAGMAH